LSFFSLAWSIIIEKPQIVQVFTCTYWGYWRNWIYILIGRTFRRKTIFHLLGAIDLFYYEVGNIQRILLRKSFNSADCYLLQSPQLERWLKQFSGKTVIGLWNGIDFTKIQTKSSPSLRLITSFEGNVGITIGNLSLNKGIVDIISVLAKIKEEGIIIGWIFIGRGDLPFYSKFAEEKGVSQQIFFMGEVEEAIKWQMLHHSDFFCLPSYAEGQPISIIEAMACGLPIISTRVGSIPEMIQDGVTGFLIIPGDVFELKNAVLNLKNNPLLYESMGANSLRICHERHNIQFLYTALKELYINLTR